MLQKKILQHKIKARQKLSFCWKREKEREASKWMITATTDKGGNFCDVVISGMLGMSWV